MQNDLQKFSWHQLLQAGAVLIETDELRAMVSISVMLRLCETSLPAIDQETALVLTEAYREIGQRDVVRSAPNIRAVMHEVLEQYRPFSGKTFPAVSQVQARILSFTESEARALFVFTHAYNAIRSADVGYRPGSHLNAPPSNYHRLLKIVD